MIDICTQNMPIPFGKSNANYKQSIANHSFESGAAQICIVDRFGNIVSITSTIGLIDFSSKQLIMREYIFICNCLACLCVCLHYNCF